MKNNLLNIFSLLVALLVLAMPFSQVLTNFLLTLVCCVALTQNFKFQIYRYNKLQLCVILLVAAYFLVNLQGFVVSSDKYHAQQNLSKLTPFAALPLLALLFGEQLAQQYKRVLKWFVAAVTIASLTCLALAVYRSIYITPDGWQFNPFIGYRTQFVYTYLSVFLYTNSFAMYVVFALAVLLWLALFGGVKPRVGFWLLVTLCVAMVYLLSSRTNVYSMFLILYFTIAVYYLLKRNIRTTIIMLIGVSALLYFFQNCNMRVHNLSDKVAEYVEGGEVEIVLDDGTVVVREYKASDVNVRVAMWQCGLKLVAEKSLTGFGLGDYNNELRRAYAENDLWEAVDKFYDQHNQYLETLGRNGILGLIVMLGLLLSAFVLAIKQRNYLMACLLIVVSLNMLMESIFNRYSNSIFVCLMLMLAMFGEGNNKQN